METQESKPIITAYRYGLSRRPPGLGAVPKGFIPDGSLLIYPPDYSVKFRFGFLDYPEKLSEEDVKGYELEFVEEIQREDSRYHP